MECYSTAADTAGKLTAVPRAGSPWLSPQAEETKLRVRGLHQQVERGQHKTVAGPHHLPPLGPRAPVIQKVPPAALMELGVCCWTTGTGKPMGIPSNFSPLIEVPETQMAIGRGGSTRGQADQGSREGSGIWPSFITLWELCNCICLDPTQGRLIGQVWGRAVHRSVTHS